MQREVDPNICRQRILNDEFLIHTYSRIYLTMVKQYKLTQLKNLSWVEIHQYFKDLEILEIGSAGGVLKYFLDFVTTSDIRQCEGVDCFQDAQALNYDENSIDLLLAKDALHHIPNVHKHFLEVNRVLKPGGKAVYLEPNWNPLSSFVYKFLHPEDWSTTTQKWEFDSRDPMQSNQALAKNIFVRDADIFRQLYPKLNFQISRIPINGLSFFVSGGVTMRSRVPASFLKKMSNFEHSNNSWMRIFGFNRIITVEKK